MKLLVDAQLPRRVALWLNSSGHDTVRTLDLPLGNKTQDQTINQLSVDEERIVATKDADFVNSFRLHGRPWKLLLISTGNIPNVELEKLLRANLSKLESIFASDGEFVEFNRSTLIIHK